MNSRQRRKRMRALKAFAQTLGVPLPAWASLRTIEILMRLDPNANINAPRRKWTSNAKWPDHVYRMDGGISRDTHPSREEAQHVCDALRREGFGGQRLHFPLRTWVEEVK